jgi:hypothetical protein
VAIYKATTTAQQNNRTIHFILLIHCLAQLPFDNCIYSPQHINIPYTFPSARLRHNISSLSTMSNGKPSCTYVKPPQALEVPVPTCTITPHGDATSTSSTCPHLPAKLWTDIFLYMDLAYLWPSCRSVSRVFQANIDFVLRSQPIPRLTGIIFKTDFKTLSHFSSDKSIAWFKSGAVPSEPLEWKRCRKLN